MKASKTKIGLLIGLSAFALVASGVGVTAAAYATEQKSVTQTVGFKRSIYLDVSNSANWQANSPKFSAYIWAADKPACFVNDAFMENVATNIYRASLPSGYTNILFVRHPSNATVPSFSSFWDQTIDLTIPADANSPLDAYRVNNQENNEHKFEGTWVAYNSYTYTSN